MRSILILSMVMVSLGLKRLDRGFVTEPEVDHSVVDGWL